MPVMDRTVDRAYALMRWVRHHGLSADTWRRLLFKGAVFTIIIVVWNGRRFANEVIMPLWGYIRHYADLQAAVSYVLVPVVAILAAWFTPAPRPQLE